MLQATEQAKNPLYKLVDFSHIEGNRKVFSTQDDNDVLKHLTFQNYGIELGVMFSTVVNFIWTKMIDMGLTAQMVIDRICETEYMDETQKEIIAVGINRFFENDYVSALHVQMVEQLGKNLRNNIAHGLKFCNRLETKITLIISRI